MSDTPTPETDTALVKGMPEPEEWSQCYLYLAVFARDLARRLNIERNALVKLLDEADGHVVRLHGELAAAFRERLFWKEEAERWRDSKGWQPIETAPKDGRHILAWDSTYGPVVVRWKDYFGDAAWRNFEFRVLHKIIRWMPLPEPPR